jgi:ABC-2 type transport system permease protein
LPPRPDAPPDLDTAPTRPTPVAPSANLALTIVRIKWRMLVNGYRNPTLRRNSRFALGFSLLTGGFGGWIAFRNSDAASGSWSKTTVTSFTLLFAAWIFAPLTPGGLDDTIDPGRLALFPLSPGGRRRGVLLASMIGFLPFTSCVVLIAFAIGSSPGTSNPVAAVLILTTALVHLLICVLAGRLVGALLTLANRSRRGRDLSLVLASLSAVGLWGATQSLVFVSAPTFARVLRILEFLPSGVSARAAVDARRGHLPTAGLRVVIALLLAGALYAMWARAFEASVLADAGVRSPARTRNVRARPVTALLPSSPRAQWRVLVGKELRYLRRSPQRRASLIISMVLGGPFLLIQFFAHASRPEGVYVAPIALVFAFGSINNLLGLDAPSLWLEITSGARLRTIVMSRSAASAPYVILPVVTAATVIALAVGFTVHYVVIVALSFAGAGIPLGVGCVASVLVPFPQHDVDHPFSNRRTTTGEGCLVSFVAGLTMLVTGILFTPIIALMLRGGSSPGSVLVISVLTSVYSSVVWYVMASLAGRHAERSSAELLSALSGRSVVS